MTAAINVGFEQHDDHSAIRRGPLCCMARATLPAPDPCNNAVPTKASPEGHGARVVAFPTDAGGVLRASYRLQQNPGITEASGPYVDTMRNFLFSLRGSNYTAFKELRTSRIVQDAP